MIMEVIRSLVDKKTPIKLLTKKELAEKTGLKDQTLKRYLRKLEIEGLEIKKMYGYVIIQKQSKEKI